MKTQTRTQTVTASPFDRQPKTYAGLCQRYVPRPLHDASDYEAARQAIEPLLGFSERLTADQQDYLEAVSTFIEAYDQKRVKWPKAGPLETLKFLLEQHNLTAADLSRLLGADRSLGPKIVRGERRLTLDHVRLLAKTWHIDPGLLL